MFLSNKHIIIIGALILIYSCLVIFADLYYLSALGVCLFLAVLIKFTADLGRIIEIRDVISFIATAQWILGPVLVYNLLPVHDLYYMSVSEEQYMSYVFPGTLALVVGLYLPFSKERIVGDTQFDDVKRFLVDNPYLGYWLVGAGILFGMASNYMPTSLSFLFFLLSNMQFVGVFLILFSSESTYKWLIFAGVLGSMALSSVLQGMFHELIMWLLFTFIILAFVIKIKMWLKLSIFTIGIVLLLFIQSIKADYRNATWYADSDKSNREIFQEIATERLLNPTKIFHSEALNLAGARLNQGWIISRIMKHIPENQAYFQGETILNGLVAGILPRVLMPNKAKAGGHENFERFTGTPLAEGTSMNLSVIGEVYGNFGYLGGIAFMFVLGCFYNWIMVFVIKLSVKNPSLVLWLPLMFFQVIKAETDFAIVINHLAKSAIVILVVFAFSKKVLKVKM